MSPVVKVLVGGWWVGMRMAIEDYRGNRGSIAPPLSLESWNMGPIISAPVFFFFS